MRESEQVDDAELSRAIEALREPVAVRDAWRASVLASIGGAEPRSTSSRESTRQRRLVLHPLTALAASLLLVAGGAVGGAMYLRGRVAPTANVSRQLVDRSTIVPSDETRGAGMARFVVLAPGARQVALVGDFNLWNANATPMRPLLDGRTWMVELPLEAGRHTYAFVVDGAVSVDPAAPRAAEDDFGRPNSVLVVSTPST